MNEKEFGTFNIFNMLIDILLINLGFYLAFLLRFENIPAVNYADYLRLIPWIALLTVIFFRVYGMYDNRKTLVELMFSTSLSVAMIMVFTMALTFLYRGFAFPRTVFALAAVLQVGLITLWKSLVQAVARRVHGVQKVLMIGSKDEAYGIAQKFQEITAKEWFEAKYIIETGDIEAIREAIPLVDIVCLCPCLSQEIKSEISVMALEKRKKIFLIPDLYEVFLAKSAYTQIDDTPIFELIDLALTLEQKIVKRFLDVLISSVGLIITLPLMLIVAGIIKLTSPGPVFYTQQRVGLYGKPFMLYKFRTMITDAEKLTGPVLATEHDPRITPVGRFLRSTRLDELPQLINVLKGEMSIVGPRPERPFFVNQFKKENPHYKYRHIVKPGITGLAQVLGKYRTSVEDKLRYDLIYIRNYSFLLDIRILFLTIKVIFMKDSSRGKEEIEKFELDGIQVLTSDKKIAAAKDI